MCVTRTRLVPQSIVYPTSDRYARLAGKETPMAATLKDLYDAYNAGASRSVLLRLIEELERNHVRVPPALRQEIVELTEVDDEGDE
jgi:hypothetical protein